MTNPETKTIRLNSFVKCRPNGVGEVTVAIGGDLDEDK
jgi:hypothetical protein